MVYAIHGTPVSSDQVHIPVMCNALSELEQCRWPLLQEGWDALLPPQIFHHKNLTNHFPVASHKKPTGVIINALAHMASSQFCHPALGVKTFQCHNTMTKLGLAHIKKALKINSCREDYTGNYMVYAMHGTSVSFDEVHITNCLGTYTKHNSVLKPHVIRYYPAG